METVIDQSVLSSGLDLSPKVRPSVAHFRPGLLCGKERKEGGGDGQRGDSSSHAIPTLLLNLLHHLR